jgi:hypothetical protein
MEGTLCNCADTNRIDKRRGPGGGFLPKGAASMCTENSERKRSDACMLVLLLSEWARHCKRRYVCKDSGLVAESRNLKGDTTPVEVLQRCGWECRLDPVYDIYKIDSSTMTQPQECLEPPRANVFCIVTIFHCYKYNGGCFAGSRNTLEKHAPPQIF